MALNRKSPVLFELMREKPQTLRPRHVEVRHSPTEPPRAPASSPAHEEPPDDASSWLGPGRTLRLPAGYAFFGIAAVIAVFVVGWGLGHRHAMSTSRTAIAAAKAQTLEPTVDPALVDARIATPAATPTERRREPIRDLAPRTAARPEQAAPPPPSLLIGKDPRTPGRNHLIIARVDEPEAKAAARFLAERGLGVAAFQESSGSRWWLVVSATGFDSGEVSSGPAQQLLKTVRRLGTLWDSEHSGTTDFGDAYFQRR